LVVTGGDETGYRALQGGAMPAARSRRMALRAGTVAHRPARDRGAAVPIRHKTAASPRRWPRCAAEMAGSQRRWPLGREMSSGSWQRGMMEPWSGAGDHISCRVSRWGSPGTRWPLRATTVALGCPSRIRWPRAAPPESDTLARRSSPMCVVRQSGSRCGHQPLI